MAFVATLNGFLCVWKEKNKFVLGPANIIYYSRERKCGERGRQNILNQSSGEAKVAQRQWRDSGEYIFCRHASNPWLWKEEKLTCKIIKIKTMECFVYVCVRVKMNESRQCQSKWINNRAKKKTITNNNNKKTNPKSSHINHCAKMPHSKDAHYVIVNWISIINYVTGIFFVSLYDVKH